MFVVWVDMLRIWPTKETCWAQLNPDDDDDDEAHECEDFEDVPV